MFTSGKKGRGDAFPSDVVCSEQMYRALSLWETCSRKSDYKKFGLKFLVRSETAVKSDLDVFFLELWRVSEFVVALGLVAKPGIAARFLPIPGRRWMLHWLVEDVSSKSSFPVVKIGCEVALI